MFFFYVSFAEQVKTFYLYGGYQTSAAGARSFILTISSGMAVGLSAPSHKPTPGMKFRGFVKAFR